jgi:DNA-directed RNA polymerase specialized sigma24 family protein
VNATSILTTLYESQEVADVIQKIKPEHIRDDVKHHVFLSLFEQDKTYIEDLHKRGKLRSYIVRAIYMTVHFPESSFVRQQRRKTEIPTECFPCVPDHQSDTAFEELKQECAITVRKMQNEDGNWYGAKLLEIYAEHGTYRKVAELTNIPLNSIHGAIKKAKDEIKKRVWE